MLAGKGVLKNEVLGYQRGQGCHDCKCQLVDNRNPKGRKTLPTIIGEGIDVVVSPDLFGIPKKSLRFFQLFKNQDTFPGFFRISMAKKNYLGRFLGRGRPRVDLEARKVTFGST